MREMGDRQVLDDFCIKFCDIVDRHGQYVVLSDFVVISSGRANSAEDIDVIVEKLNFQQVKALHDDLIKAGFVCMQSDSVDEIYRYLAEDIAVRYTLKNQPLPEMEMKFAKDELDLFQLKTRIKLPLTGIDVWFSSIDMNVAFKEELLKSEKDLKDAEHLRKIYPELINEDNIEEIKKMIRRLRLDERRD